MNSPYSYLGIQTVSFLDNGACKPMFWVNVEGSSWRPC